MEQQPLALAGVAFDVTSWPVSELRARAVEAFKTGALESAEWLLSKALNFAIGGSVASCVADSEGYRQHLELVLAKQLLLLAMVFDASLEVEEVATSSACMRLTRALARYSLSFTNLM